MKRSAALALTVCLWGCHRNIENKEAVRQGVIEYLSKRSDLMALEVQVTGIKFQNDQADALVYLSAKGGPPQVSGMEMRYILERKGNRWVVKGRGSGAAHGPGMTHGGSPAPALPPGHPALPAPGSSGSSK